MRSILKPHALTPGSRIRVICSASPAERAAIDRGCQELVRLGYGPVYPAEPPSPVDYFCSSLGERHSELFDALQGEAWRAVFCARGGYGTNYLLDILKPELLPRPRILLGYSDITSLAIFLWQKLGWVTFYGPMVASGFAAGPGVPSGYDSESFLSALAETRTAWSLALRGETLAAGESEGVLLGGCLTLVETSLGTPWELDTAGAILLLEDRGMKPYQVDRALMHLKQAGKLAQVRGILLGDFPDCEPPATGGPTVREVCRRILGELGVPIVWGAPVGHTPRPILTIPLGIRARLCASGPGQLNLLEPAVLA